MTPLHLWTTRPARAAQLSARGCFAAAFLPTRRLSRCARLAFVLALAVAASACSLGRPRPSYDMVATAEAVKPSWEAPGRARLQAREEAVARARQTLWDSLLREKVAVPGGSGSAVSEVTVEYLVATNPAFESALWAMIGRLQPTRIEDRPNATLWIQLETDRREALALAADYAARMRREGRL